jgi:hypothetical protein
LRERFQTISSAYFTATSEVRNDPGFRRELLSHLLRSPVGASHQFHHTGNLFVFNPSGPAASRYNDPVNSFTPDEIVEATRSGSGLGEIECPRPLYWTWATF